MQQVLMLDPDVPHDDDHVAQSLDDDRLAEFDAIEPDAKEEAKLIEAVRGDVVVPEGGAPPVGWRIDKFGQRLVSVPPWSRRPPTCWPEAWVGSPKRIKDELRAIWKKDFPEECAKQNERRLLWLEAKEAGKAATLAVVRGWALSPAGSGVHERCEQNLFQLMPDSVDDLDDADGLSCPQQQKSLEATTSGKAVLAGLSGQRPQHLSTAKSEPDADRDLRRLLVSTQPADGSLQATDVETATRFGALARAKLWF